MNGALRIAAFRRVWLSGLVSDSGDWLLFVALPLVVLERSGSAFGTSIAFLLELIPGMLLTPVAAWCADHVDPRRFLTAVAGVQGLTLLPLLTLGSLTRTAALAVVYAVIVIEAALTAVSEPTRNTLLPRLVPTDGLVAANSLIGLAQNAARLIGGPLGGVVYATGGLSVVAVADLASYAVAALLILGVGVPRPPDLGRDASTRATTRDVLRIPAARRLLAITAGCQIAQGMFVVLFLLFVVRSLHGGAGDVGLLRGVQAVGAIAGALILAVLARHVSAATLVAWSTLVFGVLSLLIWNGPHVTLAIAPYVALFALAGAPGVLLGTGLTTGLQLGVPACLHGRAFALAGLASNAGQGLGILAAGALTAPAGLATMLDVQAAIYLIVGALAVPRGRVINASLVPDTARTSS